MGFSQDELLDSLAPYLTAYDVENHRFRIRSDSTFFPKQEEVFLFFLDENYHHLSPQELDHATISQVCLEYKLGTFREDDSLSFPGYWKIYTDYCDLFKKYKSRAYEAYGDIKYLDGSAFRLRKSGIKTTVCIEIYDSMNGSGLTYIQDDGHRYTSYYIRFILKM